MLIYTGIQKYKTRRKSKLLKKPVKRGKFKKAFSELLYTKVQPPRGEHTKIKSLGVSGSVKINARKLTYEGEMAEREKLAQIEIEKKKGRVAPLYSKGNYQYIGDNPDPEILKGLGRKL